MNNWVITFYVCVGLVKQNEYPLLCKPIGLFKSVRLSGQCQQHV